MTISIQMKQVPVLPEVLDHTGKSLIPAGSYASRDFCASHVRKASSIDPMYLDILSDAQTFGGLLIALSQEDNAQQALSNLKTAGVEHATILGKIIARSEEHIQLR
jgi:selenide,water dikinase